MNEFSAELDRAGTASIKWSLIQEVDDPAKWLTTDTYFGENRTLPMWVADMDFQSPKEVIQALQERVAHGIYGYTMADENYLQSVVGWMKRRHGWEVQPEWIVTTPGVVPALHMLIRGFSDRGSKVLVQRPVYYPFFSAITENKKQIVSNSLVDNGDSYEMDFDDLLNKAKDPETGIIILSNPHNPVGRVWSKEELLQFGHICKENNILVISDEIHGDLIMPGHTFYPFASLEDFSEFTITCTAPSKTFNLAGLQTSNIIIEHGELRRRFQAIIKKNGLMSANLLGLVGCQAAYEYGEPWLERLLQLFNSHLNAMDTYFTQQLPTMKLYRPEGTYLAWFDCRELEQDHMILRRRFMEDAKIFLDDGFIFGREGRGFQRINIACPKTVLDDALERIRKTFYE